VKVRDVFDFTSELQCTINLLTLEELLFDELINCKLLDNINLTPEYIRWNQIKEMKFLTFSNDKKFETEKEIIVRHVQKMVRGRAQRISKGSFYVYDRNYSITTSLLEDDENKASVIEEDTAACLVIPPMRFVFQEQKEPKNTNGYNKSFCSDKENVNEEVTSKRFHKSFLGSCNLTNTLRHSLKDEEFKKSSLDTTFIPDKKFAKLNSEKKLLERIDTEADNEFNIIKKKSYYKIIDKYLPPDFQRKSKYQSSLCKEIKQVFKDNIFSDYIDNYSFLKIHRNVLEKIPILPFRNIRIDASDENAVLLNLAKIDDEEPIRINNRKIMWFIVTLISLFIAAILFIFLAT
jgi:hypothetical protein